MKEDGYVCETYSEFRQHYPIPDHVKAGFVNVVSGKVVTLEEQERAMLRRWDNIKDKIVYLDGLFFPYADIRYLKIMNYCEGGYDGQFHPGFLTSYNLSLIYGNTSNPIKIEENKRKTLEWILMTPKEILQAMGELYDHYDYENKYEKKYGEVIFHNDNLKN